MKTTKSIILLLAAQIMVSFFVSPVSAKESSALDPETIAIEAYVYLYPLVLMDITRLQMTNFEKWDGKSPSAPINTFGHFRAFPPLDFKTVVRPNFDTMYSILWLDLTKEPMILSIPDSQGRCYLMPALDMWTDVFAVPGWRTTVTKADEYAYCPPGWNGKLPAGVTRVDAPTPYIWFIGRTKTDGEKDYDAVHKFQDGMKITPLSQWGKTWKAPAGKVDPSIDMKTPPMKQAENMSAKAFFAYAAKLMKLHPPKATDFSQIARLAHVGILPGEDFNYQSLDASTRAWIDAAPAVGMKMMQAKTHKLGAKVNGWQMLLGTFGSYGIEYLQRGAVALFGLGCNQTADAIYPQLLTDAGGRPLTGTNHYVMHFDKDDLPPAIAFWSFTLYDKDGFSVPNPLNRATLSSWMDLEYNTDGSIDLYFQADSPGKDKEANWLPAPKQGNLSVALSGEVKDLMAFSGLDLKLKGAGKDLSEIGPLIGEQLPKTGAFTLDGRLKGSAKALSLQEILGNIRRGGLKLNLQGGINNLLALSGMNLNLTASGNDLSEVGPIIGKKLPATGEFTVKGRLTGSTKALALQNSQGRVDRGGLRLSLDGGIKNLIALTGINIRFKGSGMDLAEVGPIIGKKFPVTDNFAVQGRLMGSTKALSLREATGRAGRDGLNVAIDGEISDVLALRSINIRLKVSGKELAAIGPLVGSDLPKVGPSGDATIKETRLKAPSSSSISRKGLPTAGPSCSTPRSAC